MLRASLCIKDGRSSGRIWLRSIVRIAQLGLVEAGHAVTVDGRFGSETRKAVEAFQASQGLLDNGVVGKGTWARLDLHIQAVIGPRRQIVSQNLTAFEGDLEWVHEREGHRGRPYWPGGASGVTLDPGVDLGHQEPSQIEALYGSLLSSAQLEAIRGVFGLKGEPARDALPGSAALQSIRITEDQAAGLLPVAARPYWSAASTRFPSLLDPSTLPSVQTVLLSLAYNRGPHNHHLESLRPLLASQNWIGLAEKVGGMQQSHTLQGIRIRRRQEAALIRAEMEHLQA